MQEKHSKCARWNDGEKKKTFWIHSRTTENPNRTNKKQRKNENNINKVQKRRRKNLGSREAYRPLYIRFSQLWVWVGYSNNWISRYKLNECSHEIEWKQVFETIRWSIAVHKMLRYNKIYEASICQHMKNVPRKQMRQPFVSLWIRTNGMLQSEKDTNEKWREKKINRKKTYSIRRAEYPNTKRLLAVHEYSFAIAFAFVRRSIHISFVIRYCTFH